MKEQSDKIGSILALIGDVANQTNLLALNASIEAARVGSSITSQAGESFRSIVTSIRDVSSQVQEVSAASEQMSQAASKLLHHWMSSRG